MNKNKHGLLYHETSVGKEAFSFKWSFFLPQIFWYTSESIHKNSCVEFKAENFQSNFLEGIENLQKKLDFQSENSRRTNFLSLG